MIACRFSATLELQRLKVDSLGLKHCAVRNIRDGESAAIEFEDSRVDSKSLDMDDEAGLVLLCN